MIILATPVDYICGKANKILGFIWRNMQGSSKTLQKISYRHFVLDYSCTIWDLRYQKDKHKQEMV